MPSLLHNKRIDLKHKQNLRYVFLLSQFTFLYSNNVYFKKNCCLSHVSNYSFSDLFKFYFWPQRTSLIKLATPRSTTGKSCYHVVFCRSIFSFKGRKEKRLRSLRLHAPNPNQNSEREIINYSFIYRNCRHL